MMHRYGQRGIPIIQLVVYLAALAIVLAVAYTFYFRSSRSSARLTRNTEDIARALAAGERWRDDIRRTGKLPELQAAAARRPPKPGCQAGRAGRLLCAAHAEGSVFYCFARNAVWRSSRAAGGRELVLPNVKASRMLRDLRNGVESWRWELELESRGRAHIRPLFTFRAVPWGRAAIGGRQR